MTVLEVRYYFAECDDCEKRHEYEEDDLELLLGAVTSDGWHIEKQEGCISLVLCPDCVAARYADWEREAYREYAPQEHA